MIDGRSNNDDAAVAAARDDDDGDGGGGGGGGGGRRRHQKINDEQHHHDNGRYAADDALPVARATATAGWDARPHVTKKANTAEECTVQYY